MIEITIKGKVQGVFFRKYTKMKADELGISGIVKNLANGDVYIIAEANNQKLNDFISWCSTGSPLSEVVEVLTKEIELVETFSGFKITN